MDADVDLTHLVWSETSFEAGKHSTIFLDEASDFYLIAALHLIVKYKYFIVLHGLIFVWNNWIQSILIYLYIKMYLYLQKVYTCSVGTTC